VITGNVDWQSAESQVSGVSEVIVHPAYVPKRDDFGDAALLVLSTPTTAPAIGLGGWPSNETRALIAGWGQTVPGESPSTALQWAETTVQSQESCEQRIEGFRPDAELCAIDAVNSATSICSGDSGGPLIESSSTGPAEIGVTTQTTTRCSPEYPNTFTATAFIQPWVSEAVGALSTLASPGAPSSATAVPGRYATVGSAVHRVVFRVTEDGQHVVNLTGEASISCQHGTSASYGAVALVAGRNSPAPIHEGIMRQSIGVSGTRFYQPGTFGAYLHFVRPGLAEGHLYLRVKARNRQFGLCYAPAVRFFARQVGG
jgi:secreted trypsin-like serine protease